VLTTFSGRQEGSLLHLCRDLGAVEVSLPISVGYASVDDELIRHRSDASNFLPACFCGAGTTKLNSKTGVCPTTDNKMYDPDSPPDEQWNEWWLDIKTPSCVTNIQKVMAARMQTAKNKGCDAVDPDNMDGYANKVLRSGGKLVTPHSLTELNQVNYLKCV